MRQANELQAEVWNQDSAGTMFSGSTKFDIRLPIYGNLTYGPLWKTWYDTTARKAWSRRIRGRRSSSCRTRPRRVGPERQAEIAQEIFKIWVDNLFDIGTVGLTATDQGVAVVNKNLQNVPENLTKDWPLRTPGNGKPEIWFFAQ